MFNFLLCTIHEPALNFAEVPENKINTRLTLKYISWVEKIQRRFYYILRLAGTRTGSKTRKTQLWLSLEHVHCHLWRVVSAGNGDGSCANGRPARPRGRREREPSVSMSILERFPGSERDSSSSESSGDVRGRAAAPGRAAPRRAGRPPATEQCQSNAASPNHCAPKDGYK